MSDGKNVFFFHDIVEVESCRMWSWAVQKEVRPAGCAMTFVWEGQGPGAHNKWISSFLLWAQFMNVRLNMRSGGLMLREITVLLSDSEGSQLTDHRCTRHRTNTCTSGGAITWMNSRTSLNTRVTILTMIAWICPNRYLILSAEVQLKVKGWGSQRCVCWGPARSRDAIRQTEYLWSRSLPGSLLSSETHYPRTLRRTDHSEN